MERQLGETLGVIDVVGDGEGHDAVEICVDEAEGSWGEHIEPLGNRGGRAVRREGRGARGVDGGGGSRSGDDRGDRGGSRREEGWRGGSEAKATRGRSAGEEGMT